MKKATSSEHKNKTNMQTWYKPTPKSEKLMIWLCSIAGVLAMVAFLQWTAGRDEKLMQWADAYEKCVSAEYHTTPSAWYVEHGEYPECDAKNY